MTASTLQSDGEVTSAAFPCIVVNDAPRPVDRAVPAPLRKLLERGGFRLARQLTAGELSASNLGGLADQQQPFLLLCVGGEGIGWQLQAIRSCRAAVAVPFESILLADTASAKEIGQAVELGVIEVFIGSPSDSQIEHSLGVVHERLSQQHKLPTPEPDPLEPVQSLIAGAKQLSELLLQAAMRLSPERAGEPRPSLPRPQESRAAAPAPKEKLATPASGFSELVSGRSEAVEPLELDGDAEAAPSGGETAEALLGTVRLLMLLERIRYEALPVCTERDVHWQILMFLVEQSLRRKEATVTAVCYATSAPFSTAIRKIDELAAVGWLSRRVDPRDRRRYIVELSQHGRRQLIAYLRRTASELTRLNRSDAEPWNF